MLRAGEYRGLFRNRWFSSRRLRPDHDSAFRPNTMTGTGRSLLARPSINPLTVNCIGSRKRALWERRNRFMMVAQVPIVP